MKFCFLGDVHENINYCLNLTKDYPDTTIVQIGDLGVGFLSLDELYRLPSNFKFFPGNHDNRELCRKLPHFLGDYGEAYGKFFFVSGADSIDRCDRIEGVSWWPDEELTYQQAQDCLEKWEKSSVEILVSHDLPQSFAEGYKLIYERTLTRNLLQRMIEIKKPKLLIHGHHHKPKRHVFNGVQVVELGIDEPYFIDL